MRQERALVLALEPPYLLCQLKRVAFGVAGGVSGRPDPAGEGAGVATQPPSRSPRRSRRGPTCQLFQETGIAAKERWNIRSIRHNESPPSNQEGFSKATQFPSGLQFFVPMRGISKPWRDGEIEESNTNNCSSIPIQWCRWALASSRTPRGRCRELLPGCGS